MKQNNHLKEYRLNDALNASLQDLENGKFEIQSVARHIEDLRMSFNE